MPSKKTTKTSATSGKSGDKPVAGLRAAAKSPQTSIETDKVKAKAGKAAKTKVTTKQVVESPSFAKARTKAERYAKDPKKLTSLFEAAAKKAERTPRGALSEGWAYLNTMIRLIRAFAKGDYRDISWETLVAIVLAVVYFVSPIDVIPDFIPIVGHVDDLLVVGFVLKQVRGELYTFMAWEISQLR